MPKIAIVGASGHGKVVADLAEILGYTVIFFDDIYPNKNNLNNWPIIGKFKDLLCSINAYPLVVVAIGDNNIRSNFYNQLALLKFTVVTLIHPTAVISKYARIGTGTVVFANSVINTSAQIGENCIINSGCVIEHDCVINNHVHLSPKVALAGGTFVGNLSWVGIGSVTIQLINIGENVIVGANSTIIRDIESNSTVVGSPAKNIKKDINPEC